MSVNRKVLNQANTTVTTIPGDWLLRWDATTSAGIGYLTDPATNDVDEWESQDGGLGTVLMTDIGVSSAYPEYILDADRFPCMHIQGDGALRSNAGFTAANPALQALLDDASNVTTFVVALHTDPDADGDTRYSWSGINKFRIGTVGADNSLDLYINSTFTAAANDFDNRRFIASMRNVHNGTDDNDTDAWVGKTNVDSNTAQTDASVSTANHITMGSYDTSGVWDIDCHIYEVLIYGRSLSDADHAEVIDYLSAKWGATNLDSAPPGTITETTIPRDWSVRFDATDKTGFTWQTDEATGDIVNWIDQTGTINTVRVIESGSGSVTYPFYELRPDGKPCVAFDGTSLLRGVYTAQQGASYTIFCAWEMDTVANMSAGYEAVAELGLQPLLGHRKDAGNDGKALLYTGGDTFSTQTYDGGAGAVDRLTQCLRNTYNGAADNDRDYWVNGTKTVGSTGGADTAGSGLGLGGYYATTNALSCWLFEVIIYERPLLDAEVTAVSAYLSAKWGNREFDTATTTPAASTDYSWTTNFIDREGVALADKDIVGNYRIRPLIATDTPRTDDIPSGYWERWDSSTPTGMTFTTSEAVGDIATWVGQVGNATFTDQLTNDPVWNPGQVFFDGVSGLDATFTALDAVDNTVFAVVSYDAVDSYDYMIVAPAAVHFGNEGGTDELIAAVMNSSGSPIHKSTNAFTDTPVVLVTNNLHNATNDNDKEAWVGTTSLGTTLNAGDSLAGLGFMKLGYLSATSNACIGYVYEVILYDRVLTTAEHARVVNYLSGKWQAQKEDSASTVIAARPKTLFADDSFPATLSPKQWFRSDQGITESAGNVTQWDCIVSAAVMTSGADNDPAYEANLAGFPAVTFDATNTEGLTSDTIVVTSGHSGIAVLRLPAVPDTTGSRTCLASIISNVCFFGNSDNATYKTSLIAYGNRQAFPDFVHSYRDDAERIVVCAWRYDDTAGTGKYEVWFDGFKAMTRLLDSSAGSPAPMLGQASSGVHATGSVYEYCTIESLISDANMESLIRYACNRYNIPFMPDVTPRMVGQRDEGTTSAIPKNDTTHWYRADLAQGDTDPRLGLLVTDWDMRPEITEHSIDLDDGASTSTVLYENDRRAIDVIAADDVELAAASFYTWSESTTFPEELGASVMVLGMLSSDSESSGYLVQGPLTMFLVRRNGTTSKLQARAGDGSILITTNDYIDAPFLIIGTYDLTETEGRVWVYSEAASELLTMTGTATTYGGVQPVFGGWSSFNGDGYANEIAYWKHQLTDDSRESLVRYIEHRYNLNFAALP